MTLSAPPYGRDLSATDSVDASRVVSGDRLLAEACYRRLITPRGALPDDPDYGFPIARALSSEMTVDRVASLGAQIRGELLKDPRLEEVIVVVSVDRTAYPSIAVTVDIDGRGRDGTEFNLVVSAKDLDVSILRIGGTNG